ncbi:heterokaryon incompatibility protein-domain-containing protein [Phaeosphaeria sp. MPI-PUGE-AT-0046c]|nr:heterokaryon incompatibility protein-domain-containing protein [Phaeosphaeria sp. MPI-PUGE-AT-0046c]
MQNTSQRSPYLNQDLEPGEIRLLFIFWSVEPSLHHVFPWMSPPRKSLRLITKRVNLWEEEDFDAVSYVWGEAPASVSVPCNGTLLLVTPSAYEMLENLCIYRRWLWIDAICINQLDSAEKEIQIPLMRKIYAQANAVLIWMGPSTLSTEHFMISFPEVLESVKDWEWKDDIDRNPAYTELYWPWDDERLFEGFYRVLNNEWFRRLWTFQEVVLAKRSRIICGPNWIDGTKFFDFIDNGTDGQGGYFFFRENIASRLSYTLQSYNLSLSACDQISWSHNHLHVRKASVFNEASMSKILIDLQDRIVTELIDRIWAIAGLLEQNVQDVITPMIDYSSEGRLLYHKTYLNFCTAVISAQGSLKLLLFPRPVQRSDNPLPSWCPDFAASPICGLQIRGLWNDSISDQSAAKARLLSKADDDHEMSIERWRAIRIRSRGLMSISVHNHIIHARGFVVDTVAEVVENSTLRGRPDYTRHSLWGDWTDQNPHHVAAFQNFDKLISLSQFLVPISNSSTLQIPVELLMIILIDCRVRTDLEEAFRDALACMRRGDRDLFESLEPNRRSQAWVMMDMLTLVADHAFFKTAGGRLGIGIPGVMPGDKVCVIHGEEELYILRGPNIESSGNEAEAEPAEFCGVAFVPHLMEQHERVNAAQGDDVVFKIK